MGGVFQILCRSPLGPLTLTASADALTEIRFGDRRLGGDFPSSLLVQAERELGEYFAGERKAFSVPLAPEGSDFQKRVWAALRTIPYGKTVSYGWVAAKIGRPGGAVAVGQANSRNPIPIMIPCHRVVGADGRLVGYAGGLPVKEALLELEGAGIQPAKAGAIL